MFKGYSALRETLKGTRYLSTSPKVVAFGIGPEALKSAGRSNTIIMTTCYVVLDVMQFIMSDEKLYHELFANIITDVATGTVALAAGTLAGRLVGRTNCDCASRSCSCWRSDRCWNDRWYCFDRTR
ncbi:hypothetical protein [Pseudovibrio ascidiaceicola]|uniref:hypothetical protein n=1 Tax=Pseudovibrio ascidiaceicola TaxID=285279 RepID=UPI000A57721A|nr:hypothetical protein [Pseudovibrio ascidiaceicola]